MMSASARCGGRVYSTARAGSFSPLSHAARFLGRAFSLVGFCLSTIAPARAETTLGLQALYFTGTHSEINGSQHFSVPAALVNARQRWNAVDLYVEGIPSTGSHSYITAPSGFPQPVTSLSVFDTVSHVRLDLAGRVWAGGGIAVINQITSIGSPPYSAASRLTGSRYELVGYLPVATRSTVELRAALMPAMHGAIVAQLPAYLANQLPTSETAETTDFTGEYVLRSRRVHFGAGLRVINYVAHFVTPPDLADRNSGVGFILEFRYALAP